MHYTQLASLALFLTSSTTALPFEHSDTVNARALDISGQCSQMSSTFNNLASQIKTETANWKGQSSSQVLNLLSELAASAQKVQSSCFSINDVLKNTNGYTATDSTTSSLWNKKRAQKSAPTSTSPTSVHGEGAGHSEGHTKNEKKDVKDDWIKFSSSFDGSDDSKPDIQIQSMGPWIENSNSIGPSQEQGAQPDVGSSNSASDIMGQSQGTKPAEPGSNVSNTLN